MTIEDSGFEVSAYNYPARGQKDFPEGPWYGAVDGVSCTSPVPSQQRALEIAREAVRSGGYLAGLLTTAEGFIARLNSPATREGVKAETQEGLLALAHRIKKAFHSPAQIPDHMKAHARSTMERAKPFLVAQRGHQA